MAVDGDAVADDSVCFVEAFAAPPGLMGSKRDSACSFSSVLESSKSAHTAFVPRGVTAGACERTAQWDKPVPGATGGRAANAFAVAGVDAIDIADDAALALCMPYHYEQCVF